MTACAACGAPVAAGAWYCLVCGEAHAAPRPPEPSSPRRASILAALLAVAALGVAAGVFVERHHDDAPAAPVTVPTVITEQVTVPVTVTAPAKGTRIGSVRTATLRPRGGRARPVRRRA